MLLGGFANIGPITNRNGVILDGNMRFGKFILPKLAFGATAEWEVLIDGWFIFQHDYGLFLRYYAPIAPSTQILVELNPTIFFSGLGEFRKRGKSFTTNPDFNFFSGLGLHRFLTPKIGVEFLAGFYWFNNLDGLREGEQVEKAYGIETKAGIHYYF